MKPYLIEAIGTLFLTLTITFTGNALATGLMLVALVYIGGHISGGHYNPAVSLTAYLYGTLSLKNLFYYIAAQVSGAFTSLILFYAISHIPFSPELPIDTPLTILFIMEALLTMLLCLTVLTVTNVASIKNTPIYGVAIGLALGAIAFIGGLFNPAIAFSSFFVKLMFMNTDQVTDLVYMHQGIVTHTIAPFIGAAASTYLFTYINEK